MMENIEGLALVSYQNGGAKTYYEFETDSDEYDMSTQNFIEVYQKRRSYILAVITKDLYDKISPMIKWFRDGTDKTVRDGALMVQVYQSNETISFDRELITTDDYNYSDRTLCYSTLFTDGVISDYPIPTDTYRLMAIDMIWCRQDTLFQRLSQNLKE